MGIINFLERFDPKNIIAAFSSRQDGNMSLCYGDTQGSLESRKKLLSGIGIDYRDLICAKQVHGKKIAYVTGSNKGAGALDYESSVSDTDGFLTDKKNLPIAILTADCLSVFIYDPVRPAVGILHAGWRSTEKNICARGVSMMQEEFGSQTDRLLIGFGPSIRSCCCKMENSFKSNFPFGLINRVDGIYMDIALINTRQLVDCGVKQDNIFDPKLCTFSENNNFFSFRKEAESAGRMISVIMLK
ncbi:MAG: peptidoglycan editing factor PgeF [Candidatus Omnitrophica bacterium]|nr:peptidoglycan editing factor PgeF [Candidatus Omnitrophota bacterium]MBU1924208.1 peptidoglycan editing factor PgeF [Candidatus Omnitrophota bacterium]